MTDLKVQKHLMLNMTTCTAFLVPLIRFLYFLSVFRFDMLFLFTLVTIPCTLPTDISPRELVPE